MCGYVSKSIKQGLQNRHRNERIARAEKGGTHYVYQVKKDNGLYKYPHDALNGQTLFTEEAAHKEANRMMELNPGRKWVVVEA